MTSARLAQNGPWKCGAAVKVKEELRNYSMSLECVGVCVCAHSYNDEQVAILHPGLLKHHFLLLVLYYYSFLKNGAVSNSYEPALNAISIKTFNKTSQHLCQMHLNANMNRWWRVLLNRRCSTSSHS